MSNKFSRSLLLFSTLAIAACKDDAPPKPASVSAVTETSLTGVVDQTLGPLTVKVTDAGGSPVSGIVVTFAVAEGGGSVSPAVDTTDGSGEASTRWRLGTKVVAQRVTASIANVTTAVNFAAATSAAAPSTIAVSAGDNQTVVAGGTVPTAPAVLIKDKFDNPVPGVTVIFTPASGSGSVTNSGVNTNASGIATVGSWTLGTSAGTNRLSALALSSGLSGNPVTFTASGTTGVVASLSATTSTTLSGTVGAAVTPIPTVRVTDANGNPVSGAMVTFAASTGSAIVGATSKATAANGTASPDGWTLGTTAQTYTLTASVTGATPVNFSATATAGAAASVSISAGNNQTASVGRTLPIDPAVRVADAQGNPVAGAAVTFEVIAGGGTAVSRNATTNASGIATVGAWTLGDAPGVNTLRATVTGNNITGNPILFSATATAGVATAMSVQSGNNQIGTAGAVLAIAPSVVVRDSRGNAVSGVTVTFTTSTGSGTVSTPIALTNAAGVASAGSWTLGATAGIQTLTATLAGVSDVVFTASARAGTATAVQVVGDSILTNFPVNSFVSPLPTVKIVDANGNPVSGVTVTFEPVNGTGNTLTGDTKVTAADGTAQLTTWRIGTAADVYRLRAVVTGLPLAGAEPTWRVTGTALSASQVVVAGTSVQSQGAAASTAVATIPVVKVTDVYGNPVSGASVTFTVGGVGPSTVSGGGASVVVTTDNLGFASVGSWLMGAGSGTRTLTATVSGTGITGNPIVFSAVVP